VIIGLWLAVRVLGKLAREYPALAPWITPIIVLYMVFALFTWIGSPLFNLILRVDRFGRLALSREETIESNWIGGLLLAGLACLALTPLWGLNLLVAALVCGFLTVPVAGTFKCRKGRTRIGMTLYTAALAVAGVGGVALMAMGVWVGGPLVLLFVVGVVASSWVASILVMSGQ